MLDISRGVDVVLVKVSLGRGEDLGSSRLIH